MNWSVKVKVGCHTEHRAYSILTWKRQICKNGRSRTLSYVFAGSIAPSVDEKKLTMYFTNFGKVESCRVIRDKATNISKGFGFVTFLSAQVSSADGVKSSRLLSLNYVQQRTTTPLFRRPKSSYWRRGTLWTKRTYGSRRLSDGAATAQSRKRGYPQINSGKK